MRKNKLSYIILTLAAMVLSLSATSLVFAEDNLQESKGRKHQVQNFISPVRITFSHNNKLLVSDYRLKMILTVDPRKNTIKDGFSVEGKPLGIAAGKKYIFVGNESKGCVEVYDKRGRKLKDIGSPGSIKRPTDIAVDDRIKRVFVVDTLDKAVKIYSFDGTMINTIPGSPPDMDTLANPTGIALDPERQEILVSDYGDTRLSIKARIQIFDYSGTYVGSISGKAGMLGSRFSRPQGLAVDDSGHVYVVDCFSGEVLIFDRFTGKHLKTVGSYGTNPGQLRLPLDLVVSKRSRDIYVTNNQLKRIEVFKEGGLK